MQRCELETSICPSHRTWFNLQHKKKKEKTRLAYLTPVELAHCCMGKRLESVAASVSLQTVVLILCPSVSLQTAAPILCPSWAFIACWIAACHLFPHPGCRVPEYGWDLSTGLMLLAKDKAQGEMTPDSSLDADRGQSQCISCEWQKTVYFPSHPHPSDKDPTHFQEAQQQSPARLTKARLRPLDQPKDLHRAQGLRCSDREAERKVLPRERDVVHPLGPWPPRLHRAAVMETSVSTCVKSSICEGVHSNRTSPDTRTQKWV